MKRRIPADFRGRFGSLDMRNISIDLSYSLSEMSVLAGSALCAGDHIASTPEEE